MSNADKKPTKAADELPSTNGGVSAGTRGITVPEPSPDPADHDGVLRINAPPGESQEQLQAKIGMSPSVLSALTAANFSGHNPIIKQITGNGMSLGACTDLMIARVNAMAGDDKELAVKTIKQQLAADASALASVQTEMFRRASLNLGEHIGATETYMRLALRAQAQARATLETLAEVVNPRPVFLNPGQVNMANGPQQVNNGGAAQDPARTTAPAASQPLAVTDQSAALEPMPDLTASPLKVVA